MKIFLFLSILFSAIALPAFGALTDADLDKIRLVVKEKIKAEIATVRQALEEDIAKSEKKIKEYVVLQTEHLDKRLSTYNWVIYILTPLIVAAIGIPTVIMAYREGPLPRKKG